MIYTELLNNIEHLLHFYRELLILETALCLVFSQELCEGLWRKTANSAVGALEGRMGRHGGGEPWWEVFLEEEGHPTAPK